MAVMPELHFAAITLLVVTDHELPQQIIQWFVLERVLCRGDAERDVIRTWKGPRITDPARQESDRCRSDAVGRQGGAVTKGDLHVRRRQWTSEHLCDAAVCAVCADQKGARPLGTRVADHAPPVLDSFRFSRGDLCSDDVRAVFC